jgi:hypothetical protein
MRLSPLSQVRSAITGKNRSPEQFARYSLRGACRVGAALGTLADLRGYGGRSLATEALRPVCRHLRTFAAKIFLIFCRFFAQKWDRREPGDLNVFASLRTNHVGVPDTALRLPGPDPLGARVLERQITEPFRSRTTGDNSRATLHHDLETRRVVRFDGGHVFKVDEVGAMNSEKIPPDQSFLEIG